MPCGPCLSFVKSGPQTGGSIGSFCGNGEKVPEPLLQTRTGSRPKRHCNIREKLGSHTMGLSLLKFSNGTVVKSPLANAGDLVQSLGQADPLEEEMATHSSILAWRILWTEEPGGLQLMGLQKSQT